MIVLRMRTQQRSPAAMATLRGRISLVFPGKENSYREPVSSALYFRVVDLEFTPRLVGRAAFAEVGSRAGSQRRQGNSVLDEECRGIQVSGVLGGRGFV